MDIVSRWERANFIWSLNKYLFSYISCLSHFNEGRWVNLWKMSDLFLIRKTFKNTRVTSKIIIEYSYLHILLGISNGNTSSSNSIKVTEINKRSPSSVLMVRYWTSSLLILAILEMRTHFIYVIVYCCFIVVHNSSDRSKQNGSSFSSRCWQ